MSVSNNPSVSADNPFADLGSLKNAQLTERESTILSNCNYADLKIKWTEGLNNISNNARTHIRNVKEVKESFFCYLGNVLGFANSEPLKEVDKVFSNFNLFDRYVRNDISPETYKKIAKANPAYFDKVIKHLEDSAKELDIKADARIGTFCSSSTGYALAEAATRFRDTADYLKRMMHGDDAAKPGNNNANPGSNQGQPTVINHYHNNIGHIGDINIGHLGDNNFHNKGGSMGVMFKESSNGVPHTGFRPERPALASQNSYYSPTINGIKLLDITPQNVTELFIQGDKNKKQQLEIQHNTEVVVKGNELNTMRKLHREMNTMKDLVRMQKHEKNSAAFFKTYQNLAKAQKPEDPQPPKEKEKIKELDAVEQKKDTAIESRLRVLLGKYVAFWDQIHNGKEKDSESLIKLIEGINEKEINKANKTILESLIRPLREGCTKTQAEQIFTLLDKINDPVRKLKILGHVIERLGEKLSEKNKTGIDNEYTNTIGSILNNIASVISDKDKKTYNEKHSVPKKSNNEIVGNEKHGMVLKGNLYTPTEDENEMSSNKICDKLYNETKAILREILPHTFLQANEQKN